MAGRRASACFSARGELWLFGRDFRTAARREGKPAAASEMEAAKVGAGVDASNPVDPGQDGNDDQLSSGKPGQCSYPRGNEAALGGRNQQDREARHLMACFFILTKQKINVVWNRLSRELRL